MNFPQTGANAKCKVLNFCYAGRNCNFPQCAAAVERRPPNFCHAFRQLQAAQLLAACKRVVANACKRAALCKGDCLQLRAGFKGQIVNIFHTRRYGNSRDHNVLKRAFANARHRLAVDRSRDLGRPARVVKAGDCNLRPLCNFLIAERKRLQRVDHALQRSNLCINLCLLGRFLQHLLGVCNRRLQCSIALLCIKRRVQTLCFINLCLQVGGDQIRTLLDCRKRIAVCGDQIRTLLDCRKRIAVCVRIIKRITAGYAVDCQLLLGDVIKSRC